MKQKTISEVLLSTQKDADKRLELYDIIGTPSIQDGKIVYLALEDIKGIPVDYKIKKEV